MNFLKEVSSFSPKSLKQVATRITTPAGQVVVETRVDGRFSQSALKGQQSLGFVGDFKPDFQVVEIRKGLLLGSQDVAANLELLRQHNVTHILNVATGIDSFFPDDFVYEKVEILDLPAIEISTYFDQCFQFIDTARNRGAVLVHCNAGVSRSPSIILAYLMSREGLSLTTTLEELRRLRPTVRPNEGFMRSLARFEEELRVIIKQ